MSFRSCRRGRGQPSHCRRFPRFARVNATFRALSRAGNAPCSPGYSASRPSGSPCVPATSGRMAVAKAWTVRPRAAWSGAGACGGFAGPRARRSASSSAARSSVSVSTSSPRAEARVRLAVGDVRAEAAVLDDDRLAADRIGAELLERRRGRAPRPRCFGWASSASASSSVIVNSCSSRLERARLLALLHVRPVAAVLRDDLLAVGGRAERRAAARAAGARPRASRSRATST